MTTMNRMAELDPAELASVAGGVVPLLIVIGVGLLLSGCGGCAHGTARTGAVSAMPDTSAPDGGTR